MFSILFSATTNYSASYISTPYYSYKVLTSDFILINDNWSIFFKPVVVDKSVGKLILGTDFSRLGLNGRIIHSYLQYKNDNLFLFLGRSPLTWGQSKQYSIIQSDLTPTYDQFRFELTLGNLTGDILTGQLGSEKMEGNRITRLISGHRQWLN